MKKLERAGKWVLDRILGLTLGRRGGQPMPEPSEVRSVLVVRPHNQMGDMLLGTPLLRALRNGFPRARIVLLASPDNAEIMAAHPDVDRILLFDKKRFRRDWAAARAFLRLLRGEAWDVVVMPTTVSFSVTSTLLARIAGGRLRVGSDGAAYGRAMGARVFDLRVSCRWKDEHQSDRNLDFARALHLTIPSRSPSMGLTEEERAWAREAVSQTRACGRRPVGIHPGAGKLPNRWPVAEFARVAAALARDARNQVFVMVGPRESALRDALRERLGDAARYLPDLPLRRAAAVIGEFDFFLCNDTGVMHIGAALGTPTLALFGPTDPRFWAPLSADLHWLRARDGRVASLAFEEVYARCVELLDGDGAAGDAGYESHATAG